MNISGVFHPNGLEVIINTEIVSLQEIVCLSICHLICYTELFWATLLNQLLEGVNELTFGRKGVHIFYVYGIICLCVWDYLQEYQSEICVGIEVSVLHI